MLEPDAFENRVNAVTVGKLMHTLDRFLAPFAHHCGRAEFARQRDAFGMPSHDDDLLRSKALRGDHATEANRAVADHGDRLARADPGADSRVVAGAHHVCQRQEGRHWRGVFADRQHGERPIRLGNTDRLRLRSGDHLVAEEAAVMQAVCSPF